MLWKSVDEMSCVLEYDKLRWLHKTYTDGSEFQLPNGRRYRGATIFTPGRAMVVLFTLIGFTNHKPVNRIVKERMEASPVRPPAPSRPSGPTTDYPTGNPEPTTTNQQHRDRQQQLHLAAEDIKI